MCALQPCESRAPTQAARPRRRACSWGRPSCASSGSHGRGFRWVVGCRFWAGWVSGWADVGSGGMWVLGGWVGGYVVAGRVVARGRVCGFCSAGLMAPRCQARVRCPGVFRCLRTPALVPVAVASLAPRHRLVPSLSSSLPPPCVSSVLSPPGGRAGHGGARRTA